MSLQLYATFIAATVILILIPGPNVALIVAKERRSRQVEA